MAKEGFWPWNISDCCCGKGVMMIFLLVWPPTSEHQYLQIHAFASSNFKFSHSPMAKEEFWPWQISDCCCGKGVMLIFLLVWPPTFERQYLQIHAFASSNFKASHSPMAKEEFCPWNISDCCCGKGVMTIFLLVWPPTFEGQYLQIYAGDIDVQRLEVILIGKSA